VVVVVVLLERDLVRVRQRRRRNDGGWVGCSAAGLQGGWERNKGDAAGWRWRRH
jgi:hypothetical protein